MRTERRSCACGVAARATSSRPRVCRLTRRGLEVALGAAWLIDGLLQLQPYMFRDQFFINVLGMASMGLPHWIGAMPYRVLELLYPWLVAFNGLFAAVQVAIGVGLFFRRTTGGALVASLVWSLIVWVGGEGFGGLFMPGTSMLTGAPGPVIIYAALSLILWPRRRGEGNSIAASGRLGERGALGLWAIIWAGSALLELQLANNPPGSLAANLRNQARSEPDAVAGLDHFLVHLVGWHGTEIAFALTLLQVMIGFQVFLTGRRRLVLRVAIVVSSLYWALGQNFGGIFTGTGTDVGLGPLMVLLALTLWPGEPDPEEKRVEHVARPL